MEPWFDTHVHLDRYNEREREVLLQRAREAETAVIAVAADIESSRAVTALEGPLGCAVGVHPTAGPAPFVAALRELVEDPRVVAIGECGFDAAAPWEGQDERFAAQYELARDYGLAVVLHIDGEGAWERFLDHARAIEGLPVVRHYFTGPAEQAAWHAARGHYVSFGNPVRRDPQLRNVARMIPSDLLLIETDSYPLPGRNTEPAHVHLVGETIALVRGWTFDEARRQLAENTRAAFGLPQGA